MMFERLNAIVVAGEGSKGGDEGLSPRDGDKESTSDDMELDDGDDIDKECLQVAPDKSI
jgi:hypothetical protein